MPYVLVKPVAVSEGDGFVDFVIELDAPSLNEVRVSFQTANGTATGANDVQGQVGTLIFAPGETVKTVRAPLLNNAVAEATEGFWLDLFSPVNAVIPQTRVSATIFDNDASPGTPAISVGDVVVDETANTASFFVSLNRPAVGTVTVNYATGDDTALVGQDFAAAAGVLSFAPGEVAKTVTVNLTDDALGETDEFFRLVLSNPVGATLADATGVALIGRNDTALVNAPQVLLQPQAVSEGDTYVNFLIQLSAPSVNEVKVSFQTANGTANGATDVQGQVGTLTFAPGETTKVVQALLLNDLVTEQTEGFWLDLFSPVNAVIPQTRTSATIFDDDASPGTPAISLGDVVVDEVAQTASFFVSLNRPAVATVNVNFTTAGDTAQAGQDFASVAGALSFAPGEVAKTVTVNLIDDALVETDEFFQLVLSNPVGATLADATGVALIGRNDTALVNTPQVLLQPVAVGESDTYVNFLVQLSAPSVNQVKVSFQTANGTANGATDVQGQVGTLTFAPGETTKVVQALLFSDLVAESAEGFWLDLFSPVNAVIPQARVSATIFDNDASPGTPAISVGDVVVDEKENTASFFVSLNRPSVGTVTVNYATGDDTAQVGQDFAAAAGALSFAPGEVARTVTVNLIDDSLAETDEFFRLVLSNPVGATLADAVGAGLIGRNDTALVNAPQVLVQPAAVSEGDTYVNFLIQLSAPSVNEVKVSFQTANGTANGATDVQGQVGTLAFAPGETTKVVQALLLNDLVTEQTEGFWLDLFSPVNAVIPQTRTSATIFDDDTPSSPVFSYGLSNDLYTVTSALDRVVESVNGGVDTVRSSVTFVLPENVENLVLTGAGALNATGNASNNILRGTSGNNTFDGIGGIDTVVFSGAAAAYTVAGTTVSRTVSSAAEGNDQLFNVERVQFADTLLASDTSPGGNTYNAYAMINAAFNRAPSTPELSMWTSELDRLGNTRDLAQTMITYYAPGVPNEALVAYLWSTIVEVPITADALASFVGLITSGAFTQASLLEFVTLHPLNTDEIIGIVGQALPLDPSYFPPPSL